MNKVSIVTDSSTGIPADMVQELDLVVVPAHITIDGQSYRDLEDLSPKAFYERLEEVVDKGLSLSITGPTQEELLSAFRDALDEAPAVVSLFSSVPFKEVVAAARAAEAAFVVDVTIHIINTLQIAAGHALLTLAACRAANEGHSDDYIAAMVRRLMPHTTTLLVPANPKFLLASEWGSEAQRALGNLEGTFPILHINEGIVTPREKRYSMERAIERMIEIMEDDVGDGPITVCINHVQRGAEAREMLETIESRFALENGYVLEIAPAAGRFVGPGAMGLAYYEAMYE